MRSLVLLRGAPGVGKSTWIKEHGVEAYTLSADSIRLQCQSPELDIEGKECIGIAHEKFVWKTLFEMLEFRMQRGELTFVDVTNSKTIEMNRYKELAQMYRYRIFVIDFTDVSIEECKRRNASRPALNRVPEESIDKMYSRFATQKVPAGIKVLKPDQFEEIYVKKFDLNKYNKIHHIGDIHGCYTCLKNYIDADGGLKEDEFYIFCGDYIDRGIENVETIKYLLSIKDLPNVLMLEGNHDKWLNLFAHDCVTKSKEFELITRKQFENSDIDKKDLRQLYRKLGQLAYYEFDGKTVLVNHGGIPTVPRENMIYVATEQLVHGVGKYGEEELVAQNFDKATDSNTYQIFGHRNIKSLPVQISERCFNLEGQIEYGGYLRVVQLSREEGFQVVQTKNDVFADSEVRGEITEAKKESTADFIMKLRSNKYVVEKQYGNISSFNFSKNAFFDKIWNDINVRARGLYINIPQAKIVARAYDKFFNVNERPETKLDKLQFKLQFPVRAFVKENGYLGLVSYNSETDDFFITTKSNPEGDYAVWLKENFEKLVSAQDREKILQYSKENNCTFVFECVDIQRDPHIIEYTESKLYLLDVVYNDSKFAKLPYEDLVKLSEEMHLNVKTLAYSIDSWQKFYDWYMTVKEDYNYKFDGRIIEGFVIEDSEGYMVKLKLEYYNFWKFMRSLSHEVIRRGYVQNTSALLTPLANYYYGWIKKFVEDIPKEERDDIPRDIITLRNFFLVEHPEYKI